MSRMAKKPLLLAQGVSVTVADGKVTIQGSKGTLNLQLPEEVKLDIDESGVKVVSENSMLQGTAAANIRNAMLGVTNGWTRTLELNGTGYRATVSGSNLQLALGLSHPVSVQAPEGIRFEVKENKITVLGTDKVQVGQTAAKIRALRPADPYKAKGFKYDDEVIVRKAGKAAKAGGAGGK